jgi:hypothetical protein
MSEFCYIIDDFKGSRLWLSDDGLQKETADLADRLNHDGFRHAEDRRIGSCVLHVFERDTPATDIVPTDAEVLGRS